MAGRGLCPLSSMARLKRRCGSNPLRCCHELTVSWRGHAARLEWLRSRHVVRAPSHFAERLEIQRYRIDQAMRLIAPHWQDVCEIQLEPDAVPTKEPRKADSIHLPGAANRDLSADLSGAIGRTIAASYGVMKMARQRLADVHDECSPSLWHSMQYFPAVPLHAVELCRSQPKPALLHRYSDRLRHIGRP